MNLPDTPSKILIVDDEPLNIEVLSETLEDMGDISFATDGDTALKLAAEIRPDIILLDVMMPGMDGYEVCRRLKESPETKNIPVIFVTALADEADEAKGIKIGAIDYVTKPVNATIVIARTRNHLELKRYRDYLTEIAFVDGLTEIANRRRFDEHIEMEWQRARRSSDWLSVVLLDIDHPGRGSLQGFQRHLWPPSWRRLPKESRSGSQKSSPPPSRLDRALRR